MIFATVTGRLTKDATLRQAGNDTVLGFSIASNKKTREGSSVTYVDASLWGKRGAAIAQYLTKGTAVTAVGELSTREHSGKTYLTLKVAELDFSGGNRSEQTSAPKSPPAGPGTYSDADYGPRGGDDEIPF